MLGFVDAEIAYEVPMSPQQRKSCVRRSQMIGLSSGATDTSSKRDLFASGKAAENCVLQKAIPRRIYFLNGLS